MAQLTIDKIKQIAVPVLKEAGISRSSLFGSYVRGEERVDSDIDFLVEYPKGTSLFDIVGLKQSLEDGLGKSVDLVSYNAIKPRLKQYILTDQMPIL